jgi:thiamine biosynthesis lipoprotein
MIRHTWLEMGMPITVVISDEAATRDDVAPVVSWLSDVNAKFSPYLATSDVSRLNAGELDFNELSDDFAAILALSGRTRDETDGFFNIERDGRIDPSGIVKGWAIQRASDLLSSNGWANHIVEAGGDIQATGFRSDDTPWRVGIRNPRNRYENVKILALSDCGVATSGTAVRGEHIWNPVDETVPGDELLSLTVVGPSILDADRMATAAFAMGRAGIAFIANQPDLEAYAIDNDGQATLTPGFNRYVR